eukprot:TRINITY_DN37840_c0_g1_i1.p1 TRINITY_DN37840_c0_g1~~TRINITY_DN37840_c0_g1_i1.p1  ORF type:complete len:268 (+),score=56.94 TRINITY_DN37840_c0_g1_i1:25-804(+)
MEQPEREVYETGQWRIESGNGGGMLTSEREAGICERLGVTKLPDQVFEGHYLRLAHGGREVLRFDVVSALEAAKVSKEEALADVKCTYSELWKTKDVEMFHSGLNWTYNIRGFTGVAEGLESSDGGHIEMELLMDTSQPIKHFMAADLFEDDLDDCGTSKLTIKTRTMPTCWFILLRQFIRVDRVNAIIKDVRWFHKFGAPHMVLHTTTRKRDIPDMASATDATNHKKDSPPLRLYTNPDELAQTLPIVEEHYRTYKLP